MPLVEPQTSPIPLKFTLAIDIDLDDAMESRASVVQMVVTQKMTRLNFLSLIHNSDPSFQFDDWISNYACDICSTVTSCENPIYTNKTHAGGDICSNCIAKSIPYIDSLGSPTNPVYRLSDIVKAVRSGSPVE